MNQEEVVINLWVPDLWKEYDRIAGLGIGENITPVRYLNVFSLHWYFTFIDPDGYPVEITGGYEE